MLDITEMVQLGKKRLKEIWPLQQTDSYVFKYLNLFNVVL